MSPIEMSWLSSPVRSSFSLERDEKNVEITNAINTGKKHLLSPCIARHSLWNETKKMWK